MQTFYILALCLQLVVICVRAGGLAGAYERVWIYYAYQIDLLLDEGDRVFAPCPGMGRSGNGIKGSCSFNELMDDINKEYRGKGYQWLPDDQHDFTAIPDVEKTVAHIMKQGLSRGGDELDLSRRLKSGQVYMVDAVRELGATVGRAKNALPGSILEINEDLFRLSDPALRMAHRLRELDLHDTLYRGNIQAAWEEEGITVKEIENGSLFDLEGAPFDPVNRAVGDPAEVKHKMQVIMREFSKTNRIKGHRDMIWAVSEALRMSAWTCSRPPSPHGQ